MSQWRTWAYCFFKLALYLLMFVLINFAILTNVARFYLPRINQTRQLQLQQWVSDLVHQPLTIGHVQLIWDGLSPTISFQDVHIQNQTYGHAQVNVKALSVRLNVFSSLIHWRVTPQRIILQGIYLKVIQSKKNASVFHVMGLSQFSSNQHPYLSLMDSVLWLIKVARVDVRDLNVDWLWSTGQVQQWRGVSMSTSRSNGKPTVVVNAQLKQMIPTKMRWVVLVNKSTKHAIISADVYVNVKELVLHQWIQSLHLQSLGKGILLRHGDISGQVWLLIRNQVLQRVQAKLLTHNLALQNKKKHLKLNPYLSANIMWLLKNDGWLLKADQVHFNFHASKNENHSLLGHDFGLRYWSNPDGHLSRLFLVSNYLNLDVITSMLSGNLWLPQSFHSLIGRYRPTGQLSYLQLVYSSVAQPQLMINASFNNLSMHSVGSIPGFKHLSGKVNWSDQVGHLLLSGRGTIINFPTVWSKPLMLNQIKGDVYWQGNFKQFKLNIPSLMISSPGLSAVFSVKVDRQENASPVIDALASFFSENLTQIKDWVPLHGIPQGLSLWLKQAFVSGQASNGIFLMRGALNHFPFTHHDGKLETSVHLSSVGLNYQPKWPVASDLNGELSIIGQHLRIVIDSGQISDLSLNKGLADIRDLHKAVLVLRGQGHGDLSQGVRFLEKTPLTIGRSLGLLQAHGPMLLKLRCRFPLYQNLKGMVIHGTVSTDNGVVDFPHWDLAFKQIKGMLHFNQWGIAAKRLDAKLFGYSIAFAAKTHRDQASGNGQVVFHAHGRLPIFAIKKYLHLPIFHFLKGWVSYQANLKLQPLMSSKLNQLSIHSDLLGVQADLPYPFHKRLNQKVLFQLNMGLSGAKQPMDINLRYTNNLYLYGKLLSNKDEPTLSSAVIALGSMPRKIALPKQGIDIVGSLPQINLPLWQVFFNRYGSYVKPTQSPTLIKKRINWVDIGAKHWLIFSRQWPAMRFQLKPKPLGWQISVNSDRNIGTVYWPDDIAHQIVTANFKHLVWWFKQKDNHNLSPKDIPSIKLHCDYCQLNQHVFKDLLFRAHQVKQGLFIDQLKTNMINATADINGEWLQKKNHQHINIQGQVNFNSAGGWLKQWKLSNMLSGGKGSGAFNLSWDGQLQHPIWPSFNGEMNLTLHKGRLIVVGDNINSKLGIGRLLNLFSLQALPQRLTLDFRDLWKDGFAFNQMALKLKLMDGMAHLSQATVDGAVARVELLGSIDYIKQVYNLNMSVSPYVTSSAPFIATIAGGPIAGVVTWAVNKIVTPGLQKVIHFDYQITGPIKNPIIKKVNAA